jgi:hypothetical protein
MAYIAALVARLREGIASPRAHLTLETVTGDCSVKVALKYNPNVLSTEDAWALLLQLSATATARWSIA